MSEAEIRGWLIGRLPEGWFSGPPEIELDGEEVLVIGKLAAPVPVAGSGSEAERAAREGQLEQFREETREQRMRIAIEAERRFGRKLSWGASVGGERRLFTTLSIPVMTRLRLPERQVLDTLVEAGVARSRSEALAWCVRLVGKHQADWIQELREALVKVGELRRRGPA
jgi:Arc/MetJ-type ribon-helix-helix transcriptional regulator